MKTQILETLNSIESEKNVTILFAVEAGSRAWGFPSQDSDYDVRFIYMQPSNNYLRIDNTRDTIEQQGKIIDCVGWDIKKTLHLFRKFNPSLIEWLYSPIIYRQHNQKELQIDIDLKKLIRFHENERAIIYHYLHMAQRNWKEYLQGEEIWTKKYLYVLRPLLSCAWIEFYHTTPSVDFDRVWTRTATLTLGRYHKDFTQCVKDAILDLLMQKIKGQELDSGPRIPILHEFITKEMEHFHRHVTEYGKMSQIYFKELTNDLNKLFRQYILTQAEITP